MKSEYSVVYENSSDEFDIELHRFKVKVTVGVQKFSPFTTIQTVRSYSSTLVQARNLILSIYYSCVFGKRNYRVLVRVSVCVCACVCVCPCVCVCFCTITQKEINLGTRNRNTL